jgi:hypothetical protein
MKFRYLLKILILCLPTWAWAQTLNLLDDTSVLPHQISQTTVDHEGVHELHQRFTAHYGRFIGQCASTSVIYNFIMDKDSSDISFDLNYLLNVAIGEGEFLEDFTDFGIEQKTAGNTENPTH